MAEPTPKAYLALAKSHLTRAMAAAEDPVDWTDLSTYGFYCLEAAVMAATSQLKLKVQKTHPGKVQAARQLAKDHKLPDVSDLSLTFWWSSTPRVRRMLTATLKPLHLTKKSSLRVWVPTWKR